MSSENKKRKEKNCYSNHGFALKEKQMRIKGLLYYNASKRQELKKIEELEINDPLICVLCGKAWEPIYKNLCECGGFCTWGYKPNKPESFFVDENGKWLLKPPPLDIV